MAGNTADHRSSPKFTEAIIVKLHCLDMTRGDEEDGIIDSGYFPAQANTHMHQHSEGNSLMTYTIDLQAKFVPVVTSSPHFPHCREGGLSDAVWVRSEF